MSDGFDFFQAAAADQFVLVGSQSGLAPAEVTVGFILAQDDGVSLHHDFERVFGADLQSAAKFYRQDNPSQGIQLAGNTC